MKAILVAGLGFGDEGKGGIVDSLTRQTNADLVVRFNGGAQAAHHVVTNDGEHCFSQFGAGTLAGAKTYLSQYMMIDPIALINEANHLKEFGIRDPYNLLTINPAAPIITPYHVAMNRLREISRGDKRHGSCGRGIGELASDLAAKREVITAGDIWGDLLPSEILILLMNIQHRFRVEALQLVERNQITESLFQKLETRGLDWLQQIWKIPMSIRLRIDGMPQAETIIFEGAQGVLLDEWYGFHPYTTWSNCTFENAYYILKEANWDGDIFKLGVTRCYMTRHGVGPFPTEATLGAPEKHNVYDAWQADFRVGYLDLMLLDYAVRVLGGLDSVALTCVDKLQTLIACKDYHEISELYFSREHDLQRQENLTHLLQHAKPNYTTDRGFEWFCELIKMRTNAPIGIISRGPTALDKKYNDVF